MTTQQKPAVRRMTKRELMDHLTLFGLDEEVLICLNGEYHRLVGVTGEQSRRRGGEYSAVLLASDKPEDA